MYYEDIKDDLFQFLEREFVATAHLHNTDLDLDKRYVPKTDEEKFVFKEMQIYMYAITSLYGQF